ncbi:M1 family metallopeptidase [Gimesia maris]|uniref:M1 family metallopeptidase n=1 Tax=Gimesia maris TaxID=122 RepID=UPI00241C2E74|nr:M1 family metallopeptidase [Gimesia maris]|tara:strand:+ start:149170 stop:151575 length:2406 start_codon:yes stop_codon:yes gene_type:complete
MNLMKISVLRSHEKALLRLMCLALFLCSTSLLQAQIVSNDKFKQEDKFRQLEETLPTPNEFRTASGAPGEKYWQQEVDYEIDVELDDKLQKIIGTEKVTYTNMSPDKLNYLWMQLDTNILSFDSDAHLTDTSSHLGKVGYKTMQQLMAKETFDGRMKVSAVRDEQGDPLPFQIIKTMMRIDLNGSLSSGQSMTFSVDWSYLINDSQSRPARTGYEYFEEDKNFLYEIAHWYPRMAAYTDNTGWQHKQFLGRGEFTLEFGSFLVKITAPADHVVAATGELQNPEKVLTETQQKRLEQAKTAKKPMFIITPEEAKKNEASRSKEKKTWIFMAPFVRDFAFASSRKFIWDAQGHELKGKEKPVIAMSYYPNEGEPLWSRYSTHAIIHTLDVFSKYTFPYPYPVAISVNGPVGGMEYPMICFNGPRPEKDGTYSKRTKYGLISVIIHEVGHNYFPMIVNSDERQWTWMDEGITTFLQFLTEQEWEPDYPSRRGEPRDIVGYMKGDYQVPIMTNSESILQFGNNAYGKPATALNILRETVLGRELFDYAFKEYCRRWMFKRPTPADFFRTMEDASGVDLDWFWRGWFYTTDHTDLAVENVRQFLLETGDPYVDKVRRKKERDEEPESLSDIRNKSLPKRTDKFPELKDFYNEYDDLDVTDADRKKFEDQLKELKADEKKLLETQKYFYLIDLKNQGGLVMPVILKLTFNDDSSEMLRIPAEIWRLNNKSVSKLILTEKPLKNLILDPHRETADTQLSNNEFPRTISKSYFQLEKSKKSKNEMQKREEEQKKAAEKDKPKKESEKKE